MATLQPAAISSKRAREIRAAYERGELRDRFLREHHDDLLRQYAEEWIAVGPNGVVAHSKSRAGLLRIMRERRLPAAGLKIRHLSAKKQQLVL